MLKNRIVLLVLFSVVYYGNVLSSEPGDKRLLEVAKFRKEISNAKLSSLDEMFGRLDRVPGYWTSREQLNGEGLWNLEDKNSGTGAVVKNSFLCEPIARKHQREDWYKVTKYVAEFYSTITNVPFAYVALQAFKSKKPVAGITIAAAGIGSAVSHAIPRLWIHHIDTVTALSAVAGIVYDNNLTDVTTLIKTMQNPSILLPVLAVGSAYIVDVALAHMPKLERYRKRWQTRSHVLWHLIAAYTLLVFVQYTMQQ